MKSVLALLLFAIAIPAPAQQIAITIDDLPVHGTLPPNMTRLDVANSILATLKAEHMPPVYGFINGERAQSDANLAVLKAWRTAGEPLGNHTWSHPDIGDLTPAQFEAEIEKNEPLLESLMPNQDWHWFRYPFLHEGETLDKRHEIRTWLAQHHYQVAQVNMDFEDYLWNDPYARCMAKQDDAAIAHLHDTYLATADQYITVFRTLSKLVYGRDVRYILLMHIGAFDARMLPELLALYRSRGFTFISLPEATADPAYRDDPDMPLKYGGAQLEQMMAARKLKFPPNSKPYKELDAICR